MTMNSCEEIEAANLKRRAEWDAEKATREARIRQALVASLWFPPSKQVNGLLLDPECDVRRMDGTIQFISSAWSKCGAGARHSRRVENRHEQWGRVFETVRAKLGTGFIIGLVGPRGTGKTQLGVHLCRYALELKPGTCDLGNEIPVLYRPWMDVFLAVRGTYKPESRDSEQTILDALGRPALLVLDEVQERTGSEFENRLLTHVIDARYRQHKDTLLIGNLTAAVLAESLGPSIVSRMEETGGTITMDWQSFRTKAAP
jgi:DNA replication protein DnaC